MSVLMTSMWGPERHTSNVRQLGRFVEELDRRAASPGDRRPGLARTAPAGTSRGPDGPFTESRVIGSFALLEARSKTRRLTGQVFLDDRRDARRHPPVFAETDTAWCSDGTLKR